MRIMWLIWVLMGDAMGEHTESTDMGLVSITGEAVGIIYLGVADILNARSTPVKQHPWFRSTGAATVQQSTTAPSSFFIS
mmetsp:Transcript_2267/g.4104  ORF Transcript_2267/g.4104 Transcript_2267/m.4104 type:complete len:80 (+) Transcript_2267:280-519(+)